MTCPRIAGQRCPRPDCLGHADPDACRHVASLSAWRANSPERQAAAISSDGREFRPRVDPTDRRTRVGLLMPCLGLGGAEVWQLALARSVDPARIAWAGAVVTDGPAGVNPGMADELGSLMPVGHGREATRRLAAACDVLLSWSVLDLGGELAGIDPRPAIVHAAHFSPDHTFPDRVADWLGPTDHWVAVSEVAREWVHPRFRDRTSIIWNAVDPARMEVRRDRVTIRRRWGVPGSVPVAGYLGRLATEKDPDAMLRLASALPAAWHVVVVGEGHERDALAGRARDLAPGRVHLVGGDPAAGDVLSAFDALVVPSRHESFGLTLAEGLWAGLPVVATRSGLAKIVAGLVREVPVGATGRELADAVLADRSDLAGTAARVVRARAFARDRLALSRFGREWTECLARMASSGPEGSPCRSRPQVA